MNTANPLTQMGSLSGEIEITLLVRKRKVEGVSVHSKRPRALNRLLMGQTSQAALERLEWVYGLCKVAHTSALTLAWAACHGGDDQISAGSYMRFQLLLESARELGLRLGKEVLNLPSHALAKLIQICQCQTPALTDAQRAIDPEAGMRQLSELTEWVDQYVRGTRVDLGRVGMGLTYQASGQLQCLSRSHITRFLEVMDQQLQTDAQTLCQAPTYLGHTMETGVLARALTNGVELNNTVTGSPKERVECLIAEMHSVIHRMRHVLADCPPEPDCLDLGEGVAMKCSAHSAIACIETARGRLVHHIEWDTTHDGIHAYHIVAPTEWNFHPHGELQQMLKHLTGDAETIEHQTRALAQLWDPCVPIRINIAEDTLIGPLLRAGQKRHA